MCKPVILFKCPVCGEVYNEEVAAEQCCQDEDDQYRNFNEDDWRLNDR